MSQNRQREKGECYLSRCLYCLFNFESLSVSLSLGCTVEHDLDQIDYIDSCTTEEEENDVKQHKGLDANSLSSQFMAYIEQRRISHEVESRSHLRKLVFLLKTIWAGVDFSMAVIYWFRPICFIFHSNLRSGFFKLNLEKSGSSLKNGSNFILQIRRQVSFI